MVSTRALSGLAPILSAGCKSVAVRFHDPYAVASVGLFHLLIFSSSLFVYSSLVRLPHQVLVTHVEMSRMEEGALIYTRRDVVRSIINQRLYNGYTERELLGLQPLLF